ncbi:MULTISPECIES: hypothetical protein [Planktothricoides]|uniref:Uncharacterized protein n=1 Tax=Planktothricoides raciborskii GIHE-MW2 TaxID=2792601 RepID=A0AAU8JFK4_9CYAN|nr:MULTISPECIES: hypothetical protein [Planktothricoides]
MLRKYRKVVRRDRTTSLYFKKRDAALIGSRGAIASLTTIWLPVG